MQKNSLLLLCLLLFAPFTGSFAGDDGESLVNQNCQRCHNNDIYTRSNSIIGSYGELDARVRFCDRAGNSNMSEEQIQAVLQYLNETYYHLKKKF